MIRVRPVGTRFEWLKNLLVVVGSTTFFLVCLEGASALYYHGRGNLNEYQTLIESQGIRPDNKKPGEVRIFVMGESAVEGVPYSMELSFTGFLQKLLNLSGYENVRAVNLGIKGRHSFYLAEAAPTLLRYKPDAVIVYAGNNDSRDFSNVFRDLPLAWLDFKLTWNSKFYCGLQRRIMFLQKTINSRAGRNVFEINYNRDDSWHWTDRYIQKKREYMEDPQKGLDRKALAIKDFETNTERLIRTFKSHGVKVLICELPVIHEAVPGVYDVKKGLGPQGKSYEIYEKMKFDTPSQEQEWNRLYQEGTEALTAKDYEKAVSRLLEASAIRDLFPMLAQSLGEAYKGLEKYDEARSWYVKAKDLQIQSPGGDSGKTQALKKAAAKTGAVWVQVQSVLEQVSPEGIIGRNLFVDHCHFNLLGNKIMASVLMEAVCRNQLISCAGSTDWQHFFSLVSDSGGQLDPKNVSREYLAVAFYAMQGTLWNQEPDYKEALDYLNKALEAEPDSVKAHSLKAVALWHLEQKDEARKVLSRLQTLDAAAYGQTLTEFSFLKEIAA